MRDLSTTNGIAIMHFCVARWQGVKMGEDQASIMSFKFYYIHTQWIISIINACHCLWFRELK